MKAVDIKILGSGCPKCKRVEELTREALTELGLEGTITHVSDVAVITAYSVLSTPGLVINEQLKMSGRVPRKEEIIGWLQEAK